jgi:putative phage-type endonuclease
MTTREEWLSARKKGVGASEAAAVLGISPWSSPVEVWARKLGLIPEMEDNERLKTGRYFEEPIAQLYADREKVTLTGGGFHSIFHPSLPVFATPDRMVVEYPRGLEIKTVEPAMSKEWGEEETDQIPPYYVTQVAVCMSVTGLPEWDVAAFFGMNDFRIYRLKRDMELEETILSRLAEFWNRYVVGNQEPPLDGSEACAEYLARKYPRNLRPLLGADEEAEKLLSSLFAMRDQTKGDEIILTEYENRLKQIIGEAEGIQGVCGKVLWKKNKDSEKVDWEAVARAIYDASTVNITWDKSLDVYAKEFTTIKPGPRVFRVSPAK